MIKAGIFLAILLVSPVVLGQSRPATEAEIELAREALQERLLDADTAKFREVRVLTSGTKWMCGLVNAKNSYGAYVGFRHFIGMKLSKGDFVDGKPRPDGVFVLGVDGADETIVAEMCAKEGL